MKKILPLILEVSLWDNEGINTDLSGCLRISKGEYKGNREQGTGKAARETIQPAQKKRYRDIVRRGIPENSVAATRS